MSVNSHWGSRQQGRRRREPASLGHALLLAGLAVVCNMPAPSRAELIVPPATCVEVEPPPAPLDPRAVDVQPVLRPTIVVDSKLSLGELIAMAGRAFSEEQYETALAYLNAAYSQSSLPSILFNIAQTQRKAGFTRDALQSYRRFIEQSPQSPLVPEASAHIVAMEARLVAEQATQEKAVATQIAHDRAAEAERMARERAQEREQAQRELRRALAQKEQPAYKRKWFWGLMGGLVVSTIGIGVAVGFATQIKPEPKGQLPTQEPRF